MWDDDKHHRVIDKQVSLLDVKEEALKNLKACPFCGCELKDFNGFTIVEKWHLKADTYRIVCPRCGAAGPDASEIEWAGANWDSRARRGESIRSIRINIDNKETVSLDYVGHFTTVEIEEAFLTGLLMLIEPKANNRDEKVEQLIYDIAELIEDYVEAKNRLPSGEAQSQKVIYITDWKNDRRGKA